MCLAKAYRGQELLAEEIASVKVSDGKLLLTTIFGEQQEVTATIREIDFRDSRIILDKAA